MKFLLTKSGLDCIRKHSPSWPSPPFSTLQMHIDCENKRNLSEPLNMSLEIYGEHSLVFHKNFQICVMFTPHSLIYNTPFESYHKKACLSNGSFPKKE